MTSGANYLILAAGGAIGTILRYVLNGATSEYFRQPLFPWGTLLVNLSGSLLIGILAGLHESDPVNPGLRLFLFVGLLGGFTTFSSFSLETLQLMRQSQLLLAMMNILANTLGGISLAAGGFFLSRFMMNFFR
ncbi:MAG: fluoride efflux transporter CrcB [Bacteroidia bacterium]|nr:fluoride efflux transporter CrcB [Bacteroidia bacterium]